VSATTLSVMSRRVVTPQGVRAARIDIQGESIVRVGALEGGASPDGGASFDAGDRLVLPGLVDSHVHINEPGRTDWEGFDSASRAALAGGVTTLIDMPLNSDPVTVTVEALEAKRRAADAACRCDYGFWGGLIPGMENRLEPLRRAGALGFKAFLVDSGIDDFAAVDAKGLVAAMPIIAGLGVPLLVHAELPGPIEAARAAVARACTRDPAARRKYSTWVAARPAEAECRAIDLATHVSLETGCRLHIVHVSGGAAVERVAAAKLAGVDVTAETCPHYLSFRAEEVPDGATSFKCAPPIRSGRDAEALWRGLGTGVIDMIVTDHSPCPPDLKSLATGDFLEAWGGVASLGLALPAVWTGLARRSADPTLIAHWMAAEPARLAGIDGRKGSIAPGMDADLVVFDPDDSFEVAPDSLQFRHPFSPYVGRTLRGRVTDTFLRGRHVFSRDSEVVTSRGSWIQ
jgi:allantoinase